MRYKAKCRRRANDVYCKITLLPRFVSTGMGYSRAVVRGRGGPMHERALRREKVVRRSRVPLWIWGAGANHTDAQSGTAPHLGPKRWRTRRRGRPRPCAEPKPKTKRLLLLLLGRGTPRGDDVSRTWRAEAAPPGRGADADTCTATNDAAVRHDFVVIGRERRRAQHAFGAWRAAHGRRSAE